VSWTFFAFSSPFVAVRTAPFLAGALPGALQRPGLAGRKLLYVREVAVLLRVTEQHVRDFIEEGLLAAVDVGSGSRKSWRVPVESYLLFLDSRSSLSA
jgi:excisionase family DNA binding protein